MFCASSPLASTVLSESVEIPAGGTADVVLQPEAGAFIADRLAFAATGDGPCRLTGLTLNRRSNVLANDSEPIPLDALNDFFRDGGLSTPAEIRMGGELRATIANDGAQPATVRLSAARAPQGVRGGTPLLFSLGGDAGAGQTGNLQSYIFDREGVVERLGVIADPALALTLALTGTPGALGLGTLIQGITASAARVLRFAEALPTRIALRSGSALTLSIPENAAAATTPVVVFGELVVGSPDRIPRRVTANEWARFENAERGAIGGVPAPQSPAPVRQPVAVATPPVTPMPAPPTAAS